MSATFSLMTHIFQFSCTGNSIKISTLSFQQNSGGVINLVTIINILSQRYILDFILIALGVVNLIQTQSLTQ